MTQDEFTMSMRLVAIAKLSKKQREAYSQGKLNEAQRDGEATLCEKLQRHFQRENGAKRPIELGYLERAVALARMPSFQADPDTKLTNAWWGSGLGRTPGKGRRTAVKKWARIIVQEKLKGHAVLHCECARAVRVCVQSSLRCADEGLGNCRGVTLTLVFFAPRTTGRTAAAAEPPPTTDHKLSPRILYALIGTLNALTARSRLP